MKQAELFIRLKTIATQLKSNRVGSYLVMPRDVRSVSGDTSGSSLFEVLKRFGKNQTDDPFLMLGSHLILEISRNTFDVTLTFISPADFEEIPKGNTVTINVGDASVVDKKEDYPVEYIRLVKVALSHITQNYADAPMTIEAAVNNKSHHDRVRESLENADTELEPEHSEPKRGLTRSPFCRD